LVAVKPGGALLALFGVWVLCQVLGGNALDRLGITGQAAASTGDFDGTTVPDHGYNDVPHNAQGYPL
jgi:hypothetical protein